MTHESYKIKSNRLYTIYKAIALDLLFFSTYYSIFVKDVKGFTNAEVNAMGMIASLIYILLEPLCIKFISKIGNTKSFRMGNILWLFALTLMAFSPIKVGVYIGYTIYQVAFLMKVVEPIILRNNLRLENRETDFSSIEGSTYFIYSILTTIIMILTGIMYEFSPYSIVIAGYITTIVACILSFMIKDEQEGKKRDVVERKQTKQNEEAPKRNIITSFVMLIFLSGFLYSGVIGNSFSGFSILLKDEPTLTDSLITTFIVFGRISRMIASAIYSKLYKLLKNKMVVIFPTTLLICLLSIFITGMFVESAIIRIAIYVVLLIIVYMLRDPFILYIQDTIFNYIDKENQRRIVSTNSLFYKLGNVITCLISMLVLNAFDQKQYIAYGFMSISIVISLVFSILLYKNVNKIDKEKLSKQNSLQIAENDLQLQINTNIIIQKEKNLDESNQ